MTLFPQIEWIKIMRTYTRIIPPVLLIGGVVVASMFASLMFERLRKKDEGRQRAALRNWEDEGGSVLPTGE